MAEVRFVGGPSPASCEVYLDGQKLTCVRRFAMEASVDNLAIVTLELLPSKVEIYVGSDVNVAIDGVPPGHRLVSEKLPDGRTALTVEKNPPSPLDQPSGQRAIAMGQL